MSALTSRQVQLLRLVQQGLSNREIGARLEMTPRYVNVALGRVYKQLGVSSRTAAVFAAVRAELLEPTCPRHEATIAALRAENRELRRQLSQQNRALELLDDHDDDFDVTRHAGATV